MRVYVVTYGEYSDYTVCGIFSSEELALEFQSKDDATCEELRKRYGASGDWTREWNELEEWDVDAGLLQFAEGLGLAPNRPDGRRVDVEVTP